jgi:SNF2 family DNA or RNA helicase
MYLEIDPRTPTIDRLELVLEPYQVIGVSWMQKIEEGPIGGGILADFPGAGKFVQAVGLIVYSRNKWERGGHQDIPKPTLIVYPASMADEWFLKIRKYAPTL